MEGIPISSGIKWNWLGHALKKMMPGNTKWTPHDAEEDGGAKNALKKYGSRNMDRVRRSHAKWANTSTRIPNKFAQLSDLTSCC